MDEKRSGITYEEDWQQVSEPETPVICNSGGDAEAQEAAVSVRRVRTPPRHLVLTLQLAACILLGVAAFALKSIGGEVFEAVRGWYVEQLSDTAIFDGTRGLEALEGAASPDEA